LIKGGALFFKAPFFLRGKFRNTEMLARACIGFGRALMSVDERLATNGKSE
jgi:hypothetical protein